MFGSDAATHILYVYNFIVNIFFKGIDTKWVSKYWCRSIEPSIPRMRQSMLLLFVAATTK